MRSRVTLYFWFLNSHTPPIFPITYLVLSHYHWRLFTKTSPWWTLITTLTLARVSLIRTPLMEVLTSFKTNETINKNAMTLTWHITLKRPKFIKSIIPRNPWPTGSLIHHNQVDLLKYHDQVVLWQSVIHWITDVPQSSGLYRIPWSWGTLVIHDPLDYCCATIKWTLQNTLIVGYSSNPWSIGLLLCHNQVDFSEYLDRGVL